MTQVRKVKYLYVPGCFGSVDYTLHPSVRARGLMSLGLNEKDLTIDLFATPSNAQRSLFCSKDNSAFQYSWKRLNDESEGWLWANPPFDQMDSLLAKVKTEPVRVVVLSPYWPKQPWFDELSQLSESSHLLRRGETRYLSKKGLPNPPAPYWDTVLFRIDTVKKSIPSEEPNSTTSPRKTTKEQNKGWGLKDLEKKCMPC